MNFSKKRLAIIGVSLTTIALMSNTQARSFGDIYLECGLGAQIFPNNSTMAAISNVTWDLGTTAVSSNASSAEQCKGKKVAAAAFIHESYATLEQDIAKGEGKHLSALMDIISCEKASRPSAVEEIRANFADTVSTEGYAESTQYQKSEALYRVLDSKKVTSACGA